MNKKEKQLVQDLLDAIEKNSTSLWVDDLSETTDCVILNTEEILEGDDTKPTYYTGINYAITNLTNYLNAQENSAIENAKETLKNNGYIVDSMWQISDIQQNYECDDNKAYELVSKATSSEYSISSTFELIDEYANTENLKKK